jgi:hypothetical protein
MGSVSKAGVYQIVSVRWEPLRVVPEQRSETVGRTVLIDQLAQPEHDVAHIHSLVSKVSNQAFELLRRMIAALPQPQSKGHADF